MSKEYFDANDEGEEGMVVDSVYIISFPLEPDRVFVKGGIIVIVLKNHYAIIAMIA